VRPIIGCALLLAAIASAACKTTRTVALDQVNLLQPESAIVTESDQSVVLMYEPKVVHDTLVGYVGRHKEKMPSTGIKQLRVKVPAPARTALLVGVLTVGFAGFVFLASGTGQSAVIVSTTGPAGYCDIDPDQPICTGVPE
jgi:hypothetical protein